ncbi:MAG: OB-fold nucleic acid binding domain-containing protein [Candidatus Aenigmatarchaeota archaeon]
MSLEEILTEIERNSSLSREELMKKIEEKKQEFSDLLTEEGAAYLIANELGLDLLEKRRRQLEIKNIVPGMRNVNFIGRIFNITPIVNFERQDGSSGKVVNIFVGDETGFVRIPLWNDQTKIVEEGELKQGDSIQVSNGMAKEGMYGIEVSIGKYGFINKIECEDLPSLEYLKRKYLSPQAERTTIKNLLPGRAEIIATIVHVFKGKLFFEICPECSNTLIKKEQKIVCPQHGEVLPSKALLITTIIDDGTANTRAVFFREQAEKLLQLSAKELEEIEEEKRYEIVKERLLGRELQLTGRVKKNIAFDRLEFIVSDAKDLNVLEESKRLAEELENE